MTHKPFQFGLGSLFVATLFVAFPLGLVLLQHRNPSAGTIAALVVFVVTLSGTLLKLLARKYQPPKSPEDT